MSDDFKIASEAARSFDNVVVADSGHISSGIGMVAGKAWELSRGNFSMEDVLRGIEDMRSKVHTSFLVDRMEQLERGGRVPRHIRAISKAMMRRPIVGLKDGRVHPVKVVTGTKQRAQRIYVETVLSKADLIDDRIIYLVYVGLSQKELDQIEELILEQIKFKKIVRQRASVTSTVIWGPGTFGLVFVSK